MSDIDISKNVFYLSLDHKQEYHRWLLKLVCYKLLSFCTLITPPTPPPSSRWGDHYTTTFFSPRKTGELKTIKMLFTGKTFWTCIYFTTALKCSENVSPQVLFLIAFAIRLRNKWRKDNEAKQRKGITLNWQCPLITNSTTWTYIMQL